MIATPIRGSYFLSFNASTYNSCSNCGGQCTTTCLFGSCKERSAGGKYISATNCGDYGCYTGGCYLTCYSSGCKGTCYDGCNSGCESHFKAEASCLGYCSNSSDSMYTTCAGLATKKMVPQLRGTTYFNDLF